MTSFFAKTLILLQAAFCAGLSAAYAQQVTQEDARNFIAKGDIAGLEAALSRQKRAVASGQVTQDEQRDTYLAFSTTDPEMHAFTRDWLKQRPNSLFALTAQTWVDYNVAWTLRGEENGHGTYPDAMRGFSRLMSGALENALKANSLDNGYVPASDALLRIGTYKALPRPIVDYLAEIMKISPNHGSLRRGFTFTNPGWGGQWADAEKMCDMYATQITEFEGYTPRICKLEAAFDAFHHNNIQSGYIETLEDLQHPAIKEHRITAALYLFYNTKKVDELARAQMMEDDFIDVRLAEQYDRFIAARYGWPAQAFNVYERALQDAKDKLRHDPYNPRHLNLITQMKVGGEQVPHPLSYEQRVEYLKRSLVFQPFNKDVWNDWHSMEYVRWEPEAPLEAEVTLNNSLVYSRHNPHRLKEAVDYYFKMAEFYGKIYGAADGLTEQEKEDLINTRFGQLPQITYICPFIRAHRVWKDACSYDTENMQCYPREFEVAGYQSLIGYAESGDMCLEERTSAIEELYYTPIPVDLGFSQG